MDLLFACLTTAGALGLYRYLDTGESRAGLTAGVWFGVAGLVKGPAAILILLSFFVLESIAGRRRPEARDLAILVVSAAVPLAWFIPAVVSAGSGFLEEIAVRQTAGRAVSSWVHGEPPWYYLVAAPLIGFPWFFPLVSSFRTARGDEASRAMGRCVRWILAIVIPFSLISSKLPVYMVPALPAVAMLAAWFAELPADRMRWRSLALWGNRFGLMLLAAAPVAVLSGAAPIRGDEAALVNDSAIRASLVVMAAVALAGLVAGWSSVRRQCLILPFVFAAPVSIMLTAGATAVNDLASSRLLVDALARQAQPGDDIGMYYTPHLWSRDMPEALEEARQFSVETLREGARPAILAVRADKVDVLGDVLADYAEVSSIRFMGKTFHVYRRE